MPAFGSLEKEIVMGRILAVANQKGGVGKTTTVLNLGAAIAETGKKVLLVDFDSQGGLSTCLGLNESEHTIEKALFDESPDRERYIHPTCVPTLWGVPASIDLAGAEMQLQTEINRERFLLRALRPWKDRFDYILIDSGPSLGLLVINALAASDAVLIPVQCEFLALRAMGQLLQTIEKVKSREIQPTLEIAGILPTIFNPSKKQCGDVVDLLRRQFGTKVFQTVIRMRSQFSYSPVEAKPVTVFDPKSDAAEMYRSVARELLGQPVSVTAAA
jgi:chromosome partitioning protein